MDPVDGATPPEDAAQPESEIRGEPEPPWIWLPPLSLIAVVVAIPLLSIWLAGPVGDRLAVEVPKALPIIDAWRAAAVAAIVGGLALILAVSLAVVVSRDRPRLVLWMLETGVRIGILGVGVLVLVHGVLSMGLLLGVEQIVLGRAFPATGGVLLFGSFAAAVYLTSATLGKLNEPLPQAAAIKLGDGVGLGLTALVARLAERMGAPAPDQILIGVPFESWSSEASFATLDGTVSGRTLCVSLPGLGFLSEEHLEAILAPNLAHFRAGDTVWSVRQAPALSHLDHAIETLRAESQGVARIAAAPGIRWLEYVAESFLGLIHWDRRRVATVADLAAAEVVGAQRMAEALAILAAVEPLEDRWAEHLQAAIDGRAAQPLPDFGSLAAALRLPERSALDSLLGEDANGLAERLIELLRPIDARVVFEALNPPRLTPGTLAWLLIGIAGFVVFSYAMITGPIGQIPIIAAILLFFWLLYALVYPYLQREIALDDQGIRIRPWWHRWMDRDAEDARWTQISWADRPELTIGIEAIATFATWDRRVRLWLDPWPRREIWKLIDGLRARGVPVHFSASAESLDDERRAVVYGIGKRLLVPGVRRTTEDRLVETNPVKVLDADFARLVTVLTDRLSDRVQGLGTRVRPVEPEELARLAGTDPDTFVAEAKRVTIGGYKNGWSVRLGDQPSRWNASGNVDGEAAAWAVFQLLSLRLGGPPALGADEDEPNEDLDDELDEEEPGADSDLRPGPAPGP
ncbi:MAG: hypothetical protein QOF11_2757 [Chloroflexota bacterium]|nr:hypothetical protein [Chloroflexota bacterium]